METNDRASLYRQATLLHFEVSNYLPKDVLVGKHIDVSKKKGGGILHIRNKIMHPAIEKYDSSLSVSSVLLVMEI